MKEVFKTKPAKASPEGKLQWDERESFKTSCGADTAFVVQVKEVHPIRADEDLGQGSLLVNGPPQQSIRCGKGTVVVKVDFKPVPATDGASSIFSNSKSEASPKNAFRMSFMRKERSARLSIDDRDKSARQSMDV